MEIALPVVVGAGVVAVVLLGLVVALGLGAARSRRTRVELAAARAETAALAARLDVLATRVERPAGDRGEEQPSAYVITDAGSEAATDRAGGVGVPDRLVLSATLGEPLVRAVALGHGVRRALSAESRNRIRFEVRRETRRTRKQRRREMKDAWRRERTATPAGPTTPAEAA